VTVHAAATSVETLTSDYLPLLVRTAAGISADWALQQSRPFVELRRDQLDASAAG
jgi:IclR family transcriptional regulator, pca regulon regulatory protein